MAKREVKVKRVRPRRKKPCPFCLEGNTADINYKDSLKLRRFMSDRGKIMPRRNTFVCAKHQRLLSSAIKRSRVIGLVPFAVE